MKEGRKREAAAGCDRKDCHLQPNFTQLSDFSSNTEAGGWGGWGGMLVHPVTARRVKLQRQITVITGFDGPFLV